MIRAALWVNFFVLAAMAAVLCLVALPAGIIMAIPAVLTLVYMRCIRRRIAFAAAHLQAACDALASPSGAGITSAAVVVLLIQTAWNGLWSLAAVGVNAQLAGSNTTATSSVSSLAAGSESGAVLGDSYSSSGSSGDSAGTLAVFLMLISFYWGSQVFSNVMHFVTATVVGHWWFGPSFTDGRSAVWTGFRRAFTTSFGSIAFGSLIVAVLRAMEQMARSSQRKAAREGNAGVAFAAACLVCLLSIIRRITEYMNQ
jgi:hypothetical protein